MTDDIIKNIYEKYLKGWFKKNYKFLLVILIYILYQGNFIISVFNSVGLRINDLPKTLRMIALVINDLVYVLSVILMFKTEIVNGLKDLKKNFTDRALLSLNCWIVGCLVMTISSVIISLITKQNVSTNESMVRQSIQIAPFYMLFTCAIVAPILEEMTFRRAIYGLVKNKWAFILISGLGFGLLHILGNYNGPLDLLYVIPYGSMGCAFAYILSKTNNIALPIIIHMIHNIILVSSQIIGG